MSNELKKAIAARGSDPVAESVVAIQRRTIEEWKARAERAEAELRGQAPSYADLLADRNRAHELADGYAAELWAVSEERDKLRTALRELRDKVPVLSAGNRDEWMEAFWHRHDIDPATLEEGQ